MSLAVPTDPAIRLRGLRRRQEHDQLVGMGAFETVVERGPADTLTVFGVDVPLGELLLPIRKEL